MTMLEGDIFAGTPTQYLEEFAAQSRAMAEDLEASPVAQAPCGTCTACCKSGYAVLEGVPVTRSGKCPKLIREKCSIYEDRPATCRVFDCRTMFFTGLHPQGPQCAPIRDTLSRRLYTRIDTEEDDEVLRATLTAGARLMRLSLDGNFAEIHRLSGGGGTLEEFREVMTSEEPLAAVAMVVVARRMGLL